MSGEDSKEITHTSRQAGMYAPAASLVSGLQRIPPLMLGISQVPHDLTKETDVPLEIGVAIPLGSVIFRLLASVTKRVWLVIEWRGLLQGSGAMPLQGERVSSSVGIIITITT